MIFRYFLLVIGFIAFVAPLQAQDDESSCIGCHIEQDEPYSTPAEHFASDIHATVGLSCENCHGGNPEAWDYDEAKADEAGFIGVPEGLETVEMCGTCHSNPNYMRTYNPNLPTDQVAKYWTSSHGISLKKGDQAVADCASCHNTHRIHRVTDPGSAVYHANVSATCATCHADKALMSKYGLDASIPEHYAGSVHGEALLVRGDAAAPTCNNCHGNHGAIPPDTGSLTDVCGLCHVNNKILFSSSIMGKAFEDQDLHSCMVCHTAHDIQKPSDAMLALQPGTSCSGCHVEGDPGALALLAIRTTLDSLNDKIETAKGAIQTAESRGMEVEEPLIDMQTARTSQIQTRTMVHSFNSARVDEEAKAGFELSEKVIKDIDELFRDFRMRKIGLGIATIFITFLALILYLYIKTLD
ncbi:cytochrome c3 family protein [Candidatus Neomarinimicrobiota bacterium]